VTTLPLPLCSKEDSAVGTDTTKGLESRRGLGIFLFTTTSRTALGPTLPPIQWVSGALSWGVKRPGREADHSPPSSAKIKNASSYTSTPQYIFTVWCLVKHRDNFTFIVSLPNKCMTLRFVSSLFNVCTK
jgi:hypothetical protein